MFLLVNSKMWNHFFIISVFFTCIACNSYIFVENPGPKFPPTKGAVWPQPQYENKENIYYVYEPSQFQIKPTNYSCEILTKAIERYSFAVRVLQNIAKTSRRVQALNRYKELETTSDPHARGFVKELQVDLSSPCEDFPHLGMDESYDLTVDSVSVLKSQSIWGILRGLESWSQLFYLTDDYKEVRVNKTQIMDFPRYSHRGLLLDTSRHYISLSNILKTLNAMSMNKMNVFHWHIVDDQSFPYQSEKFPELSARGAYHPSMVYTKANIQTVINYARDRGIRVLPEFDVPGHTRSWGVAYPSLLTECYADKEVVGLGPMNPTNNATYKLLQDLIAEIQEWFPDKYFHIGGDEVELDCWASNPELKEYMNAHNLNVEQLHGLFMENVIPLLQNKSNSIVWQEVFDEGVPLSTDILIQVWRNDWVNEMIKILRSGHKLIFSSTWYLDHLKSGGDWMDYYNADPREMVYNATRNNDLLSNIIGGEACMWGEVVNDANVISRVWPRASAVAERLWSPNLIRRSKSDTNPVYKAENRLEEHTCRMNRRGVAAQPPNGPGMCLTNLST